MNTLLLQPTDVLFFRDGRPMGGASAGHGAAWPLPTVVNHALHAALHRAGGVFQDAHAHRRGRSGVYSEERDRRFGSLVTAGPFPVRISEVGDAWFFPRPADADDSGAAFLHPHRTNAASSLPRPCHYPVVSSRPPSKENPKTWWSEAAWNAYLGSAQRTDRAAQIAFMKDSDFSDTEHAYGIGINPNTGTVQEGQFYSANYLRLRENWRLGLFAEAQDKTLGDPSQKRDLIKILFNSHPQHIVVGGQQRVCTALRSDVSGRLPLPLGLSQGFAEHDGKFLVKWILLSPAIWPEIPAGTSKRGTERHHHPGGWLPNWICPESGDVLLEAVTDAERKRRRQMNAAGKGYESKPSRTSRLVAALVPKPIPVTGWALPNGLDRPEGGAKSTHLAVPAGAVYYFEASSENDAQNLAAALNWHGRDKSEIRNQKSEITLNRRSTLMGEKGFGLGVCGTWRFHGQE